MSDAPTNTILIGDAYETLRSLPDNAVNCIVTSPPYWGQRDYGATAQIGQEETFAEYLTRLTAVFREARRVLRPDGTLWLNMGDSFANDNRGSTFGAGDSKQKTNKGSFKGKNTAQHLPEKSLHGQPFRLAFALQDDGWLLRQDIIWHKDNAMPSSAKDRFCVAHEYVFLFCKSRRYYFDQSPTMTPIKPSSARKTGQGRSTSHKNAQGQPGQNKPHSLHKPAPKQDQLGKRTYANFNARYDAKPKSMAIGRSVWRISVTGFVGAHFATFPEELARRCLLSGCPEGGIVLDPFFGSGTVGVVAEQYGRNWLGVELNPDYAALAEQRIANPDAFRRRRNPIADSPTQPLLFEV